MALNNTTADALANAISTALGIDDSESQQIMRDQWRIIYAALKADIVINVTVTSVSGVTTGGGTSGPGSGTGVPQ